MQGGRQAPDKEVRRRMLPLSPAEKQPSMRTVLKLVWKGHDCARALVSNWSVLAEEVRESRL